MVRGLSARAAFHVEHRVGAPKVARVGQQAPFWPIAAPCLRPPESSGRAISPLHGAGRSGQPSKSVARVSPPCGHPGHVLAVGQSSGCGASRIRSRAELHVRTRMGGGTWGGMSDDPHDTRRSWPPGFLRGNGAIRDGRGARAGPLPRSSMSCERSTRRLAWIPRSASRCKELLLECDEMGAGQLMAPSRCCVTAARRDPAPVPGCMEVRAVGSGPARSVCGPPAASGDRGEVEAGVLRAGLGECSTWNGWIRPEVSRGTRHEASTARRQRTRASAGSSLRTGSHRQQRAAQRAPVADA